MLSSDAGGAAADVLVGGLLQAVMAQIGGAGPDWSGCRSSLRPAVWAWSGAVATRGVNQAGDHADGAGVRQLSGRARLRPECSRRPGTVERADLAVAQPVVDQCEQFARRGAANRFGALFGDVSAVHDGVRLAVARGQPGP